MQFYIMLRSIKNVYANELQALDASGNGGWGKSYRVHIKETDYWKSMLYTLLWSPPTSFIVLHILPLFLSP